jgi:hypothetical protein
MRTAAPELRANDLPALFFVGPPRTATTWLHSVLKDRMSLPRLRKPTFSTNSIGEVSTGTWLISRFMKRL